MGTPDLDFRIGQQVVCVNVRCGPIPLRWITEGQIYEIEDIFRAPSGRLGLELRGHEGRRYRASRFLPYNPETTLVAATYYEAITT